MQATIARQLITGRGTTESATRGGGHENGPEDLDGDDVHGVSTRAGVSGPPLGAAKGRCSAPIRRSREGRQVVVRAAATAPQVVLAIRLEFIMERHLRG